jgi:membrane-associated phospholipid phosphatase
LEARLVLQRTRFLKSIIQLLAFIAAWFTCMSRVSDFKHHFSDVIDFILNLISVFSRRCYLFLHSFKKVIGGALVGFSVAIFVVSLL